ncbi:MAG: phosphotransferase [Anaerolineales bacterium]
MQTLNNNEKAIQIKNVLSHYQLGELVNYTQNTRGCVNLSFAIQTLNHNKITSYFLRQYKIGIVEEELLFEHSLINHICEVGQPVVARVHPTREGKTYVMQPNPALPEQTIFYAIFDFLPGEDKYTWVDPHCTPKELVASAQVLAQYHQAVWNFSPFGFRREPRIAQFLEQIKNNLHTCISQPHLETVQEIIQPHLTFLDQKMEELIKLFHSPEFQTLPQLIIHCDFHPGNLKFQDENVVGLFDLDWAKLDYRLFDVALAIYYFCTEWEGIRDGELRLDEAAYFIASYQTALQNAGKVPQLSVNEKTLLNQFIEAANLYVLNWSIEDILHKKVILEEYIPYILHGVHSAIWLADPKHQQEISQLAETTPQIPPL